MTIALTIALCGLLAAWSGGSLWPSQYLKGFWTNLPEIALSCVVGYALWHINPFYALGAIIWFYAWFQSGHANALSWGANANPNRSNTLTPIVDFIYRKGCGRGYSAVFFSVKGFLMTLPIGGLGALYWPLAYDIGAYLEQRRGWDNDKAHKISEVLSGVFLGIHLGVLLCLAKSV